MTGNKLLGQKKPSEGFGHLLEEDPTPKQPSRLETARQQLSRSDIQNAGEITLRDLWANQSGDGGTPEFTAFVTPSVINV